MRLAVVGATGAVGSTMLRLLRERRFPADEVVPFASERSAGRSLDGGLIVRALSGDADLGLLGADGSYWGSSMNFGTAAETVKVFLPAGTYDAGVATERRFRH